MLEMQQIAEKLRAIAIAARANAEAAEAVRDAIFESGLLDVFGMGAQLDVVDLLDAGGEDALRARLGQMPLADLRTLVQRNKYDPDRASARWRSPARFIDLIVAKATEQLEAERNAAPTPALAEASWML